MRHYENYLCYDRKTGDIFIVKANTPEKRDEVLEDFGFYSAAVIKVLTDEEAEAETEMGGLNIYSRWR